jgi:hypothetical protein
MRTLILRVLSLAVLLIVAGIAAAQDDDPP